jgi:hypothetical protein
MCDDTPVSWPLILGTHLPSFLHDTACQRGCCQPWPQPLLSFLHDYCLPARLLSAPAPPPAALPRQTCSVCHSA